MKKTITVIALALAFIPLASCQEAGLDGVVQSTSIAEGWASNSINAVIFSISIMVDQGDGETLMPLSPQPISILEWRPE